MINNIELSDHTFQQIMTTLSDDMYFLKYEIYVRWKLTTICR